MGLVFVLSYSILLFDTISFSPSSSSLDEASLPNNTTAPDLYSSGAEGGYSFTKPFKIEGVNTADTGAYIGSDGFLYTGGYGFGNSSTFYKQTYAGGTTAPANTIVDYDINYSSNAISLDTSGVVRVNTSGGSTTTQTWSTITVGGVTSGHQAVGINQAYQMVLAKNGAVYVSEDGETTMSSIAISTTVASNNGGVKDIVMGQTYQYVLFNNGALYGGEDGSTSMSSIATGITMFDFDSRSTYIYVYDTSNQIRYASANGSYTHSWTTLGTEAGVKQIRGGYGATSYFSGWGYINSANVFKQYDSATAKTSSSATVTVSNVAYIDCTSHGVWGYLNTSGKMYIWRTTSSYSSITTNYSSTTQFTGTNSSGLTVPNLQGGITDISSTPPTAKILIKWLCYGAFF